MIACEICGALVVITTLEKHQAWHAELRRVLRGIESRIDHVDPASSSFEYASDEL